MLPFLERYLSNPTEAAELDIVLGENPVKSNEMKDLVPEWYSTYIDNLVNVDDKESQETIEANIKILTKLTLAANYLDCNPLRLFYCMKFAAFIKNKSPEQLKEVLNIDLSLDTDDEDEEEEKEKSSNETKVS